MQAKLGRDDDMYNTVLRDVSEDEFHVWPDEINDFFNQFARQKAEFS